LENTSPWGEGKNISRCHLGEKYEKAKRKRGENLKEKDRKEKEKLSKKMRK
jgi:hypothetical protein